MEPDARRGRCRPAEKVLGRLWAIAKTHYRLLKTEVLAEVVPKGVNGNEIKSVINYENVMPAARFPERDCRLDIFFENFRLDKIINGLD